MSINTYSDWHQNTQSFTKQNLENFTELLREKAAPDSIEAKVALKKDCLTILLESTKLPNKNNCLKLVQQTINNWEHNSIKKIYICGRIKGEKQLAWRQQIQSQSLTTAPDLSKWLNYGVVPIAQNSSNNADENHHQKDQLLRFPIGKTETALLELSSIKEIVRITTTEILPVPHMSNNILGIYNFRGNILWLADLNQILGLLTPEELVNPNPTKMAIIVELDTQFLGLVVSQVEEIEQYDLNLLQPTDQLIKPSLKPFIKGYLQSQNSLVLNPQAIFELGINNSGFRN